MLIKKLVPTLLRNNKYCKKLLYDKFVMLRGSIVRTGKLALILTRFINLKRKAKKRKEKVMYKFYNIYKSCIQLHNKER